MKATWLCSLACVACTVPKAPEPGPEVFEFSLPLEASPSNGLRAASVWVEGDPQRFVIANDTEVRSSSFRLRFELPGSVDLSRVVPSEVLVLADSQYQTTNTGHYTLLDAIRAGVYRPRVVAYEDDGDGALDLDQGTPDRLVAMDLVAGVAVLEHPESAVRGLTLEQADAYYRLNEGGSRFLQVNGFGGELSLAPRAPIALAASRHAALRENVVCARAVSSGPSRFESSVQVDSRLDVADYCRLDECVRRPLTDVEPPLIAGDLDVDRYAQCRRDGDVESLLVSTAVVECEQCACGNYVTSDAWVAPASALPEWWPCGDQVPYCLPDGNDVVSFELCAPEVDGGAEGQGPLDTGVPDGGRGGPVPADGGSASASAAEAGR